MSKKILFLDMDGTALCDDKSMSSENIKAIRDVLDAGHILAVNTGRGIHSTMLLMEQFEISHENLYLLCFQGNLIYHPASDRILYSDGIDRADGIEKLKELNAMGIHAHTYDKDGIVSVLDNDNLREYMRVTHEQTHFISSWDDLSLDIIPKIIAIELKEPDKLVGIRERYLDSGDDRYECFFSYHAYLEFTKKGVDKGTGVREFARIMGVDIADTVAMGDQENDIPMLREAGVGIAVANAVPGAIAAADHVTSSDNNHSAVAEAILRIFGPE